MRKFAMAVIGLLAAGCGSDGPTGNTGSITIKAGANQNAEVGSVLQPYQVKASRAGAAVAGVTVSWSVVAGGGSVTPATSVTDGQGIAEAIATLGTITGSQTVRATASGYSPAALTATGIAGPPATLVKHGGDGQVGPTSQALPLGLEVLVTDQYGNAVQGVSVAWAPVSGGGTVSGVNTTTNLNGVTSVVHALSATPGPTQVSATVASLGMVTFDSKGIVQLSFTILGGGNNVPDRFTSDLWVQDGFGYTGTWGGGNEVYIWQLGGSGAPVLADSIIVPNISTVSDVQVSEDGAWLVFTAEGGGSSGLYVYQLTAPGNPVFRAKRIVSNGLHTGTLATIGGKLYAFAAKDPANCALEIYDLSQAAAGTVIEASATPIPDNYCIHDTFVRDGYAFVFAWNEGLYIFDVGNGSHGGSPSAPVQISHTRGFGGETHNGWWFWNPNGEKRYLFIGEEGPGALGSSSSGDIHVVDVSDMAAPVEVGSYHLGGAGTHNFWVDEPNQILYAAYYNLGVVAIDISGTITGSMRPRELARIAPGGGGNTYTWGVQLYNGSLYASDMLSGFWQLSLPH